MTDIQPAADADAAPVDKITFHYIKSGGFKVVHCDGAIGAVSPTLSGIHMALFSERAPLPLQVVQKVEDGTPTEIISRVGREGVVREIEVDVIMSLETAERLGNWLLKHVKIAQDMSNASNTNAE